MPAIISQTIPQLTTTFFGKKENFLHCQDICTCSLYEPRST